MEKKPTLFVNALLWGSLTGIVVILYTILLMSTGNEQGALAYVSYLFMIAGMAVGTITYRNKSLGGGIKYATALGSCSLISIVIAVLTGIFTYIYMEMSPEVIDMIKIKAEEGMREKGSSEEEIEMGMKYAVMFMTPGAMAAMTVLGYSIFGFILALITAAVVVKETPNAEASLDNNINPSAN